MTNRIHLCQTCARDRPLDAGELTLGERLSAAFLSALVESPLGDRDALAVRKVPCLSGCPSPCNVSFRAPGKLSLRFSHLGADNADDLIRFAALYVESEDGDIDVSCWPSALVGKLSARTPAPGSR